VEVEVEYVFTWGRDELLDDERENVGLLVGAWFARNTISANVLLLLLLLLGAVLEWSEIVLLLLDVFVLLETVWLVLLVLVLVERVILGGVDAVKVGDMDTLLFFEFFKGFLEESFRPNNLGEILLLFDIKLELRGTGPGGVRESFRPESLGEILLLVDDTKLELRTGLTGILLIVL